MSPPPWAFAASTSGATGPKAGRAERLAEACGIALQLTNILRDVREDVRNGRIYLPRDDLDRFGVAPRELDADRPSDRLRDLLAFEAQRAYEYYDRARAWCPWSTRSAGPCS